MRTIQEWAALYFKGLGMGTADVVPGVSGGTVAFISGIYEELIGSIRGVSPRLLTVLRRDGFAAFWQELNGTFLLVLGAGIATGGLTFARLVKGLLESHRPLLFAFFFGLIVASAGLLARQWRGGGAWVLVAIGAVFGAFIGVIVPTLEDVSVLTIFLAATVAICAMILPGISGSFILLLLGVYHPVIDAITSFDLVKIAAFGSGCAVGILAFSHFLGFLLKSYREQTMALLTGFMVGSLGKVWPWQVSAPQAAAGHETWVMPATYAEVASDPQVAVCVGLMVAGFLLVFLFDYWARRQIEGVASRLAT